jgi:hypothetical protein
MKAVVSTVLCLTMAFCIGCQGPATIIRDPGRLIGRPKPATGVGRIVSLWEAAEGSDPEGMPTRGFAGQIMFFTVEDTPVKVDGKVVIYQYDQYDDTQLNPQPIHSFTFEPDAWNVHCTNGTLGQTYSVFVPYMAPNTGTVNCGLRVEFHCADGRKVSSDITSVLLLGKSSSTSATTSAFSRTDILSRQIGRKQQNAARTVSSTRRDKLDSVTIPLPRR